MYFSYAPAVGVVPNAQQYLPDSDAAWAAILGAPEVAPKFGSCLRGAQFYPEALAPTQMNVARSWGLLFDLDEWGGEEPPAPEEIAALVGARSVLWTSYNHTPAQPRYALFVPLQQALAPHQHRFVWEQIQERLGGLAAPGQFNLDRLRWVPRLPDEAARANYFWAVYGGEDERLDPFEEWPEIEDLVDDLDFTSYRSLADQSLEEPDRTGWVSDDEAKRKAKIYFQNVGPGIEPGSRHHELFKVACKLWWDFWLEYEAVAEVLHEVNQRFPQPKPLREVYREVDEAFARTRGHVRVQQNNPDGSAKEAGCMRNPPAMLSLGELKQLAQIEKKSTDHRRREVGDILSRLVPRRDGHVEPIAAPDYRDTATRIAARFLGQKLPDHDPAALAQMFAGSLSMSESQDPGAPLVEGVQEIIQNAQEASRQRREQNLRAEEEALAHRIDQAFGGSGRLRPYTQEEIQQFADEAGCTLQQWKNRWVVVVGSSHYIFVGGDYKSPVGKENFENAAFTDLSPATEVTLHKVNKSGELVPLERKEIIKRHGTICRNAVVDLTAQRSYYDSRNDVFHEAPCPLRRDIEPEYVEVVDEWLKRFPDPRVIQWVANFTILDRPSAALYLEGQPKSGKTLFAYALARLYTRHSGPTDMSAYFDTFNSDIIKCPLLFADEKLPKQLLGKYGFDHFREMVQSQSRSLKRKYLANSTLRGYYRLLLAANNDRMLPRGTGFSTEADISAVSERLIYVPLDGKPADFLQALSQRERQAFIDEDLFAKHALWLRDHRDTLINNDRFLVSGGASRVTHRMEYEGVKGQVLEFIYTAITGEAIIPLPEEGILPIFYDARNKQVHIGVNANVLNRRWDDVMGDRNKKPLMVGDLSDAIRTVLLPNVGSKRARFGGKQRRYRIVDSRHVVKWAEYNDYDAESVMESLIEYVHKNTQHVVQFESAPSLKVINGGADE